MRRRSLRLRYGRIVQHYSDVKYKVPEFAAFLDPPPLRNTIDREKKGGAVFSSKGSVCGNASPDSTTAFHTSDMPLTSSFVYPLISIFIPNSLPYRNFSFSNNSISAAAPENRIALVLPASFHLPYAAPENPSAPPTIDIRIFRRCSTICNILR